MTSSRLKSEEIYREHVASDSLFSNKSKSNATNDLQDPPVGDVTEKEEVLEPPPLSKITDSSRPKSKVASLFDDSDSDDDLFNSASPDSKSLKSIERTPSKRPNEKKKNLFDNDNDLFGSKDAPDVDLFAAAPVKSLSKVVDKLFDENKKSLPDNALFNNSSNQFTKSKNNSTVSSFFDEISNSEKVPKYSVNSLFGKSLENVNDSKIGGDNLFKADSKDIHYSDSENKIFNQSVNSLIKEPTKVEKLEKSSNVLFQDSEDFLNSDLFPTVSKQKLPVSKKNSDFFDNSECLFEDDLDYNLFKTSSNTVLEKNIVEHSSENLFDDLNDSSDLFKNKATETSKQEIIKENVLEDKSKISKSKKLTTSIFDDSDEDDQDLFGGLSFSKKADSKKALSIFEENKSININEDMEEKKIEENKIEKEKYVDTNKNIAKTTKRENKDVSARSKLATKSLEKSKVFDDNDEDDDNLFRGNKKAFSKEKESKDENSVNKKTEHETNCDIETQSKVEINTVQDASSKNAILAEIKQKLEKYTIEQSEKNTKAESSVVDGAVSSKKEPPKTLKIQSTPPTPNEASSNQQVLKKPAMSGKIKNLMGKMSDLKILSPTDTPPLWRKKNDEKNNNDNEHDIATDLASSEASTPSLPSSESSPCASGTNSRAKDSPSSKSDNTEVAISFDEPAQVETLASIASKSRVRIPTKRRPQSRHARQSALRISGIDFDIVDTSENSASADQSVSDFDVHSAVDRLLPSKTYQNSESSKNNPMDSSHVDDKSELSISKNTATNLLSPSTDEEDLFDVPPDLPEDSLSKEDSLFGRAPILSPIANLEAPGKKEEKKENQQIMNKNVENWKGKKNKQDKNKKEKTESIDPLRDDNHDPLKDPSQLFAFVTKTPSPDKNIGLLLNKDDDSLFSSSSKSLEKKVDTKSKPTLDLFVDDDDDKSSSDLFSSNKRKMKRILKDSSINLLDAVPPEDDDSSLFGSMKKKNDTVKTESNSVILNGITKLNENMETKSTKTNAIFDNSSDDEDIFVSSKKPIKKKTQSLFQDNDDSDEDIFGKSKLSSSKDNKTMIDNERVVAKKSVTKDLKKTAKKIIEDPLSILQDD